MVNPGCKCGSLKFVVIVKNVYYYLGWRSFPVMKGEKEGKWGQAFESTVVNW